MDNIIECGGFIFTHNFDSGNLGHVEQIPKDEIVPSINSKTSALETPDYEFNIWTRPDCAGTEFENGNRTWFFFGIQSAPPFSLVKLNLVNLNRQGKMYSQGMAPVTKTIPGRPQWERIRDKPVYFSNENIFTLSFKFRAPESTAAITYFAFTYPYSYTELQTALDTIDTRLSASPLNTGSDDDIYYWRECVCYSLERRRVDLLTISSRHGITSAREERLKNLFPDKSDRPFKFTGKKIIFVSARVHPGETPSSFVFNGFLNLLLNRHDPIAVALRKLYVFKMIPFLNPDGVARGHYRTDTRGVNLNRVYLSPCFDIYPTVYAARSLIRFYHFGFQKEDSAFDSNDMLIPPPCEEDKYSSAECLRSKSGAYPNPDQENDKSYQLNTKRKKVDSSREFGERWMNPGSKLSPRPPLQSSLAIGNGSVISQTRKIKLAIDSEDDTSSSLIIASPTLADQVEDLKLNELQQSMDGFIGSAAIHDECAMDNVFKAPTSILCDSDTLSREAFVSSNNNSNLADDHDDDNDVVVRGPNPLKQLKDTLNDSRSLLLDKQPEGSSLSSVETSGPISMSASLKLNEPLCDLCKKTVMELESRMPGISNMLPAVYKNKDLTTVSSNESKPQCINFHSSVRNKIVDKEEKSMVNNFILQTNQSATNSSTLTHSNSNGESSDNTFTDIKNETDTMAPTTGKLNEKKSTRKKPKGFSVYGRQPQKEKESSLFLYIDLHGHASKKGIFMYGNYFEEIENSVECMLLPRIMSLNNLHFHFSSCNFTERNMYLRDRRDGMSREGSGRVAVLKATGLVRSYTLECNYNTGRLVNVLPAAAKDPLVPHSSLPANMATHPPPKYTPHLFEEVGKSLGASILDMTGSHPNSRIQQSEHRNLTGIRDWLRLHSRQSRPSQTNVSGRRSASARTPRTSGTRGNRPLSKPLKRQETTDPERKENLAGPGYRADRRISLKGGAPSSAVSRAALRLHPGKARGHPDPSPLSKSQRNLSLVSIRKPSTSSRPPAFAAALAIRPPYPDEPAPKKGTARSLAESNRGEPGPNPFRARSAKSDGKGHRDERRRPPPEAPVAKKTKGRPKEGSYQKQPAGKLPGKRPKLSQLIKYGDGAKEKYRIRRVAKGPAEPETGSESTSGGGDDGWETLCTAGGSGTGVALPPAQRSRPPVRPALRRLAHGSSDAGNLRRHKFT